MVTINISPHNWIQLKDVTYTRSCPPTESKPLHYLYLTNY